MDILNAERRLHARYGPVLGLQVGNRLQVSVADRYLAHTALVGHGTALADRPDYAVRNFGGLNAITITSANYGPIWRLFRRNLVAEIAHPARLRLFAPLRASVVADMTEKLWRRQQEAGNTGVVVRDTFLLAMFHLLVAMCFGERVDDGVVREIISALRGLMIYSLTKLRVLDYLPAVTTRLFRGRLDAMHAMRSKLKEMYLPLIDARMERKKLLSSSQPPSPQNQDETRTLPHCYVDSLLDLRLDSESGRPLTDDEVLAMCSELLIQGTDTTATALEWIMAELVKNQHVQDKLFDEISIGTDPDDLHRPEGLHKIQYLRAVVLEGLRRHPPGHQVVMHAAAEDMEIGGCVIPRGTPVNFMVADMALDEKTWDRPREFLPERFLAGGDGDGVDITGTKEIKMMPFGAGRRICPGLGVATMHLEYLVENLVRAFYWRAVEGEEVDVVSEEAQFTVVMKKPLCVRLVQRAAI
ncbi:cytochrome P450 89A2-like [Triticum dicoccoides]|uniref:cytochrome P450 89A2-like n=1 Tax=Triticum dicoccoides TaxID=85692 RepID=UPI00188E1D6F|nr:cytochrome P450 89A2-like [Triticum dicoccoides]